MLGGYAMAGGPSMNSSAFNASLIRSVCRQLFKRVLDCIGRWSVGGRLLATQVVTHNPVSDAERGRCCFLSDACRLQKATQVSRGRVVQ